MIRALMIMMALGILACGSDAVVLEDLHGQWYSRSWTADGQNIRMRAWMDFDEDGWYRAVFQDEREQGNFILKGSRLTTTPEEGEATQYKVERLEADTLILNFERAGAKEQIRFVRGKVIEIEPGGSIN